MAGVSKSDDYNNIVLMALLFAGMGDQKAAHTLFKFVRQKNIFRCVCVGWFSLHVFVMIAIFWWTGDTASSPFPEGDEDTKVCKCVGADAWIS